MPHARPHAPALALLLASVLAACGGDVTPVPSADMTAQAREVFTLTNAVRTQGITCRGVTYPASPALTEDRNLNFVAQQRAQDIARTGEFVHDPKQSSSYVALIEGMRYSTVYPYTDIGENLGMAGTATSVVTQWQGSVKGHCETQFTGIYIDPAGQQRPGFRRMGAGEAVSAGGQHYWVTIFSR